MTKDPRPQDPYIVPWVPLRSHAWCFEELFMDFDSSTIYLGPKSWYSSLKHFQGLETHTNFSKSPNGINLLNHSPMIHS